MTYLMRDSELKEIYIFALDLGRRAGKILLDGVEKRTGEQSGRDVGVVEEKMNAVDIVCSRLTLIIKPIILTKDF